MCGAVPTIIQLSWSLLSIAQLEKQQIKDMRLSDLLLSLFLFNNHERKVDFKKGLFLMFSGFNKTIIPITWVFFFASFFASLSLLSIAHLEIQWLETYFLLYFVNFKKLAILSENRFCCFRGLTKQFVFCF